MSASEYRSRTVANAIAGSPLAPELSRLVGREFKMIGPKLSMARRGAEALGGESDDQVGQTGQFGGLRRPVGNREDEAQDGLGQRGHLRGIGAGDAPGHILLAPVVEVAFPRAGQ